MKIKGKIRGGYAEGYETGLSLMESMVPAGGMGTHGLGIMRPAGSFDWF
jgi:hypothetical protein